MDVTQPQRLVERLNSGKGLEGGRIMARKQYSPEQIIVMLREEEVLECKAQDE